MLVELGVKECTSEGSSYPTQKCQSGGVFVGGSIRGLEESRRGKHLSEHGATVNMKLKCYFSAVVVWGLPPPAHPCACNFWLVVSLCLFISTLLLDSLL